MIKVLGGGLLDGSLGVSPDFSSVDAPLGRVLQSLDQNKDIYYWLVEETDSGSGELLSNGYFANPASLAVIAAVNSVNGQTGDVELQVVDVLSGGELLSVNKPNEIQATQSNPFPLASSVTANSYLDVVVAKENTPITTTHLPSGSDTTSGVSGDGFIIEWETGGLKRFVSDGISKWREF